MEHIKQYDWCSSLPDRCFITEEDLDNSVTERILRNKFRDPTLSSDSEDERPKTVFDWDQIFKRNTQQEHQFRIFVPGLRPVPPYPKLSALTAHQQYQCLKVLCSENPTILDKEFVPRPTKQDHRVFEELKVKYAQEQEEYKEWARTLWTNAHCSRGLRPKPTVETVYEAEFKMKANEMQSFPKTYKMAAQIPLEDANNLCEMIYQKELKKVHSTDLPQIDYPLLTQKCSIIRPSPVPEPCNKHPSRFILPSEQSVSTLPLTEVHRELSQFALESGAKFVASEGALKCLMELDRAWMVPVSVCEAISADGDKNNVVVLGSEFSVHREPAMVRTYKAFKHLLEFSLIPPTERLKLEEKRQKQAKKSKKSANKKEKADRTSVRTRSNSNKMSISSDEDEDHLFIDIAGNDQENIASSEMEQTDIQPDNLDLSYTSEPEKDNIHRDKTTDEFGIYNCTCKDTEFEMPPPRSYKKWVVRNKTINDEQAIIVHCSHKIRGQTGELVLEPIPEYQLELAGCQQSPGRIASLALSLILRRNASLLNVRIDSIAGDIVTIENVFPEEFHRRNKTATGLVCNRIHSTLNQLEGLVPGHYVLRHDASHGTNALLYAPSTPETAQLTLDFNCNQLADNDEAKCIKTPPVLAPVLLPYHKYRKILPLAFTPHETQLAKEPKRPVTRQKTPPQAIRWPKKRKKKNKN
ncbi:uncharacterized protein LOC106134580 isoform X2 [Amyelois transitella]|uniref:uncharacterized protein LOC106134580 isoform X2 n=1 Tax=Amyelois transitella TaxID=680683 RepID=UPI00067B352D|nr:uncharacterized protein LOC106134580 isoform X2 [Amyelois transitella]